MADAAELPGQVHDRDSFLAFVRALIADRRDEAEEERARPSSPWGPGADGWENGAIEQYLEAALRWAEDSGQLPEEPSWEAFATFLARGKRYE